MDRAFYQLVQDRLRYVEKEEYRRVSMRADGITPNYGHVEVARRKLRLALLQWAQALDGD